MSTVTVCTGCHNLHVAERYETADLQAALQAIDAPPSFQKIVPHSLTCECGAQVQPLVNNSGQVR